MTGRTQIFGVIGDPIAHTFSPQIHANFAQIDGLDMAYAPFHITADALEAGLKGAWALGIKGLNVTIPHKRAVMPFLTDIDPMAAQVGSVNTLVLSGNGYTGYNTDHIGITQTISAMGLAFSQRPVVVLGAGGSAYAACVAAAYGGASRIRIHNRTLENAAILAEHIQKHYNIPLEIGTLEPLPPADEDAIVIQTTTLGFGSAARSPVKELSFFARAALAFDLIYAPWETPFLKQAKEVGIKTVNGFPILVYQAAASFLLWRDRFFPKTKEGLCADDRLTEPARLEALAASYQGLHAD